MRRMKSKQKLIQVVGEWTGVEDEVTQWLTDNDYVWKIQTEDETNRLDRIKQEQEYLDESGKQDVVDAEARVRLVIVGSRLWEQWQLDKGESLCLREKKDGRESLFTTYQESLDSEFDEVV